MSVDYLQLAGATAPTAIDLELMTEVSLENQRWPRKTLEEQSTPASWNSMTEWTFTVPISNLAYHNKGTTDEE